MTLASSLALAALENELPAKRIKRQPTPTLVPTPAPIIIQPGQVFKDCSECPEMVVIPAGSFLMGSPDSEIKRKEYEGPQRTFNVKSFAIGKTEVTQGQWRALMGNNPSHFKDCGDDCPVENVSWNIVQEYIKKLNAKSGKNYSLPSETQWEYAARAGTTSAFHTGNTITSDHANFNSTGTYNESVKGIERNKTVKVASYKANNFGLYDMHGNVWEWTQNCYSKYAFLPLDGSANDFGLACKYRMVRGGSWSYIHFAVRSAARSWWEPEYHNYDSGFRLAMTL